MRDVICKIFKNKNDSYLKESRCNLIKIFNDRCNIYYSRIYLLCLYICISIFKNCYKDRIKRNKIVICN